VRIGTSRLTLLDAGELSAAPAGTHSSETARGVLGLCLGVKDFAAAENYLKERVGVVVRGVGTGSSIGRLLTDNTHGVSLFLSSPA
jgi:hypothetical protein